ncbi:hypothetical protein F4778DRAFT_693052 [Xylariomycetidae sp. FL2044]|nr:hypothetical protein F4778DRAFT_693052 [Xylariomycetidae sp. FL2044]
MSSDHISHPPPDLPVVMRMHQPRPKGVHTKHLTEMERFRVRILYYDACMTKKRICEITGYSESQVRTAVRAPSAAIGKRAGRPKGSKNRARDADQAANMAPSRNSAQPSHLFPMDDEDGMADDDDEDGEDDGDNTDLVQLSSFGVLQSQSGEPSSPPGTNFTNLPEEIRFRIWKLVLISSPDETPASNIWFMTVLPQAPWLGAYVYPEHQATYFPRYVNYREAAARKLCLVNREARKAVFSTFTPVWSMSGKRFLESNFDFVWIDQGNDVFRTEAESQFPEMFGRARKSILPAIYGVDQAPNGAPELTNSSSLEHDVTPQGDVD